MRHRRRHGRHRSLWLHLRQGNVGTIAHPSRLHEQVQVHPKSRLIKVDKFLLTLGAWVGTSGVCHVRLEGDGSQVVFCFRFDGRYRVWLTPLVGKVVINSDPVGPRGAILGLGDVIECGSYTFELVSKPLEHDRRGPLSRPGRSIVLDEGRLDETLGKTASKSRNARKTIKDLRQGKVEDRRRHDVPAHDDDKSATVARAIDGEPATAGDDDAQPASSPTADDLRTQLTPDADRPDGGQSADMAVAPLSNFGNAYGDDDIAEDSALVVHESGDTRDVDELDLDDVEATDSSVELSLATASRLRTRYSDDEIPVAENTADSEIDARTRESSSSRSAWRRPRFAAAGETVIPIVVKVPAVSDDKAAEAFSAVRERIDAAVNGHTYYGVILEFSDVRSWTSSLTPQLIQLCEDVEARGGICAASRLSVDFLPEFQQSGLPECFTLYPTTERAIAALQ